jgi:hypothetical protein
VLNFRSRRFRKLSIKEDIVNVKKVQIVVGVPTSHLHAVLDAMAEAGAGVLGNYTHCAYISQGIGRFKPNESANPAVGEREQVNEVEEWRIETLCLSDKLKQVMAAIRKAHPYEEPMLYLIPLLDEADV